MPEATPVIRWADQHYMWTRRYRELFAKLEDYHSQVYSIQQQLKESNYRLPRQPLYAWSRRVEYPFVIEHLPAKPGLRVLDAGSGVTFLPLFIRQMLGMRVGCLDREAAYAERLAAICDRLGIAPAIQFHVADLTDNLRLGDNSYDVVICVSVLEHLPITFRVRAALELWRLVAPGGRLLLTVDVSCDGEESEGLLESEIPAFLAELAQVIGPLPDPVPVKHRLTTGSPGYGLAPLLVGNRIVRNGPRAWVLRWLQRPLSGYASLACLLCSIPKPGIIK